MAHIYKLNFSDGSFYIGQTTNLKARIANHESSRGKGSPLLEQAFKAKEYLGYEVIAEVSEKELDQAELELISTLNPPLNTLPGGKALRGLNHPRTKYSKEQIMEVINLFLNSDATYQQIADVTEVHSSTVHDILKQRSHDWATSNIDPKLMQAAKDRRAKTTTVYDKNNNCYEVELISEFEKEHNIPNGTILRLKKGSKNSEGWSLEPHKLYELTSPEELTITLTQPLAKELLEDMGLSRFQVSNLIKKSRASGGWKVKCHPH